ncbi:hypothetical protein [Actinoplanes sp. URMC 104]|uniref:hypothetical protein n=1 Tax=Actinoplanes sp. URMC 104 TaxID=3423409 RepID=UPI003F1E0FE7
MPIPDQWREAHSAPGYVVCAHRPCTKKARPSIVPDHVCCGQSYHNAAHEAAARVEEPAEPVYTLGDAAKLLAGRLFGRRPPK